MTDVMLQGLNVLARALEIIGAGTLVLGFIIATTQWIYRLLSYGVHPAVARYRQSLGRVVLIGLEILVVATIIKTVTLDPTVEGIGLLAIMIVIRTILGWTTTLEMNGRWPWQRP